LCAISYSSASKYKYPDQRLLRMTKYKLLFLALALCTLSWTTQTSKFKCKLLPDGKYQIKYTFNSTEKPSIISISKDRFSKCCSFRDTLRGQINWIYDCYFTLKVDGISPDTSSELNKLLHRSFGEHCFELKNSTEDTIFFRTTYTGNVHITVNEGRFVRTK
ncbi:hypothetical protein, partial [Foetidibacter luteolus]|uniref:hypothetical protein n=1 Tax=Foetidibacter luteolus TaxID=2608880 RepID=UPI001A987D12